MKRQHWLSISLMVIALIGLVILVQPVAPAGAGDGGESVQGGGGSALSIAGDTFVPESSNTVFQTNAASAVAVKATTAPYMHAPVNLPDGAQITSLVFYYYDNNDPGYMIARLIRNNDPAVGGRASLIGGQSPDGAVGYGNISVTSPTPEVVDNDRFNYEIEVYWSAASTEANGLRLMGVKIVYSD